MSKPPKITATVDDGDTMLPAPGGCRVYVEGLPGRRQLQVNFTSEGIICDLIDRNGLVEATQAAEYADWVEATRKQKGLPDDPD